MGLEIGQTFSLAVANDYQVYSWGLNDYTQLARIPGDDEKRRASFSPHVSAPLSKITPKIMACGDDHGLMLDQQGNVYTWGSNAHGELGVGDDRLVSGLVHLENQGMGWRSCAAKGKTSYLINSLGQAYKWPNTEFSDEEMRFTPQLLEISNSKVKFTSLSAGNNFMLGLTTNGSVFAHGKNTHGQLGLGDFKDRSGFVFVRYFGDHGDKIGQVSCGHAHVIAKSQVGGIFSWGFNMNGQLGNGCKKDTNLPKFLRIAGYQNNIFRVRSVQAGYSQSFVLCDDEQVFFSGQNGMTGQDESLLRP
jgi:alpha-tubulin suppressor-like RCC1 family protein